LDADQTEDDVENRDDWQFISLDDERIGIKTSNLEEKSIACDMLCVYAKELRGGFAPYVSEVSLMSSAAFGVIVDVEVVVTHVFGCCFDFWLLFAFVGASSFDGCAFSVA
jgi:hypothetical protein